MFPEIRTQRLSLRQLEIGDAQRVFEYRSCPDVSRFQSWGTKSIDDLRSHISGLTTAAPGTPEFVVSGWNFAPARSTHWGLRFLCAGARATPSRARNNVGSGIPESWYATEAVRALLDYLFDTLGKHRVFGSVDPRNRSSIRLLQRVGMREEAHFVKSLWFKDEWVDDVIFAILASEWKSINQ